MSKTINIDIGDSILAGPEGKRGPAGSIKSTTKPETTDTVVWVDTSKDAPDRVLELGQIMGLQKKYENLIQNETSQSPSDAEIVDARGDFDLLSGRLNDNDTKVKAKPYYFNTVAEMKSSKHLKDGDCAITLGYYSVNDGGNATYKIRTKTSSDVDDGGSIHYIGTDLVAELIIENGTVNVLQFGAKGDGITDNYEVLQNVLNYISSQTGLNRFNYDNNNTIKVVKIPCGRYYSSQGIEFDDNNSNSFENGIFLKGENKFNTYLIFEKEGIIFKNSGTKRLKIDNLSFSNNNSEGILVSIIDGLSYNSYITNCIFRNSLNSVYITNPSYFYIKNCDFSGPDQENNYFCKIEFKDSGEYVYIDNVHFEGSMSRFDRKGLIISGISNVFISNCDFANFVGGKAIYLDNSLHDTKNVYINNTSFMRNLYSIYVCHDYEIFNLIIKDCFHFCTNTDNYTETFIYAYRNENAVGVFASCYIDNLNTYGTIVNTHYYFYSQRSSSKLFLNHLNDKTYVPYSGSWYSSNHLRCSKKINPLTLQTEAGKLSYEILKNKCYATKEEYPKFKSLKYINGYKYSDEIMGKIFAEYDEEGVLTLKFLEDPGSHWTQFILILE